MGLYKRRRENGGSQSNSNTSVSDNSALLDGERSFTVDSNTKSSSAALTVSTPVSVKKTLSAFKFVSKEIREAKGMADKGDNHANSSPNSQAGVAPLNPLPVSNEDLMKKLDTVLSEISVNGGRISKLSDAVEDLHGKIFELEKENDFLKEEIRKAKERESELADLVKQACFVAEVADRKSEDTASYVRRNNLRIYGVPEQQQRGKEETQEQCEQSVLDLFKLKLKVTVCREDLEAVHRLGKRQNNRDTHRGIIVRFVSRRIRDQVIFARRKLTGSHIVITEDLTPRGYALLSAVKADKEVCKQAWSKNGRVFMKTVSGSVVQIQSVSDLRVDADRRKQWAGPPARNSPRQSEQPDRSGIHDQKQVGVQAAESRGSSQATGGPQKSNKSSSSRTGSHINSRSSTRRYPVVPGSSVMASGRPGERRSQAALEQSAMDILSQVRERSDNDDSVDEHGRSLSMESVNTEDSTSGLLDIRL